MRKPFAQFLSHAKIGLNDILKHVWWNRSVTRKRAERPVFRFIETSFDLRDSLLPNFGNSTITSSSFFNARISPPKLSSTSHHGGSWSCMRIQQPLQIWMDYFTVVVPENRKLDDFFAIEWNWVSQSLLDIRGTEKNILFFQKIAYPLDYRVAPITP